MFKVILRSSEAISVVLNHYLSEKDLNIKTSGEIMIEQDTMEVATEVFQLLLEKNLVSPENVEFINESIVKGKKPKDSAGASEEKYATLQEKSVEVSHDTRTIKDKVLDFVCEISPQKVTIKEIAEKLGLKYQATRTALGKLYHEGKVDKDDKKMYFKKLSPTEVVEEVLKKEEPKEKKEVITHPTTIAEEPTTKAEKKTEDSEEVAPECTLLEKAQAMQKAFSDENNMDILNYIFFKRKNNFEVKKIRSTFGHAESERISKIISLLAGKEIIKFDEKLPPEGRYVIIPIGRMYANLLKNKEPMEEGALRTAAELGIKEFQSLIEEALKAEIIEKTVEKRVTRYAVKQL